MRIGYKQILKKYEKKRIENAKKRQRAYSTNIFLKIKEYAFYRFFSLKSSESAKITNKTKKTSSNNLTYKTGFSVDF